MSDLPRLLLCCFDVVPAPTAISRRLTEYLKGLSERYQVVVLSVKTPDHTHIERYQGARLLRVPVGAGDLAARVQAFDRAVRRQLDSEEYVMVHFFDPFGGYALCERRSEFGYKLVYDACSLPSVDLPFLVSEAEANRRFIARVRRQELFCLMNADVVIVANELTRDFVAGLGVPREQVQVLPAPVDLGPYDPRMMGVPDATPMKLLHLGNQSNAQDLTTLLEAMQLALQTVDVRLTVLGPRAEEHQARLEEQVAALKLTGKVDFQPPVAHDDLHKVLAAADVGLLTLSDVERNSRVGSPLSRLGEYLAAGRPVIAADVAAARALLPDDGVVLYRPQDRHSLADAIVTLATEPNRRVKLGAAARAASLERDGAKVRADLVAIYVTLSGTGVRAIGDAEATNPDEVTQLGRTSLEEEDTQKRKAQAAADQPSGTNKVGTDPAIAAEATSPEASAGLDRPSVMGVPLREEEEPPVVVGTDVREAAAEFAQLSTEPNARRSTEPPVVMGMPLVERTSANPEAFTPADLAAELGEIPASAPSLPAPTAPVPDEPRHLDDAPATGSHLSIVPREPEPARSAAAAPELELDEPLPTVPTMPPAPANPLVEAPAPLPPPRPSVAVFIPPLEMPPSLGTSFPSGASAPPSLSSAPTPPSFDSGSSAPPPLASPPPPLSSPPPLLSPPSVSAPPQGNEPLPNSSVSTGSQASAPSPLGTPPLSAAPSTASAPSPIGAPPLSGAPSTLGAPRPSSAFSTSSTPPQASAPSTLSAARPPLPLKEITLVPLLTLPPLPSASSSRASGFFAAAPALVQPSAPKPTSGAFVAHAPVIRRDSGNFVAYVPPSAPLRPAPAAPSYADKANSGLFPEAPSVPASAATDKDEEIFDGDIEQIFDGDGPVEVGADEIVEVPETEPPPTTDESVVMASEESVTTVDTDASPPPSAIDPWLAQLVHGYCPPESGLFERHTPPTTMPGRDT